MSAGQHRAYSADPTETGGGGAPSSVRKYAANTPHPRRPQLRMSSLHSSRIQEDQEGPDRCQRRHIRVVRGAVTSPRFRDTCSPIKRTGSDLPGGQKGQHPLTEVEKTWKFLQKDIEARRIRKDTPTHRGTQPDESQQRLLIVSARLPFTILLDEDAGSFEHQKDTLDTNVIDLLAAAEKQSKETRHSKARFRVPRDDAPSPQHPATSLRTANAVLVGMPIVRRKSDGSAIVINDEQKGELEAYLWSELKAIPVYPPPNRNRYAELVILPLFHYAMPNPETGMGLSDWEGYELVNETFRDAVINIYSSGDIVWINDYPLMLLPKLLRKEVPHIHIGFYLHCAFPSSEVYRIMPQREHILRGVLSSNIIGFHNFLYTQHFLSSCVHILGLECTSTGIEACEDAGGTHTKVTTVPLGINLLPYQSIVGQQETKGGVLRLDEAFGEKRLLVAVDLLEEKKGIPHKIMAFHKFLQKAPHWASQCVFIQVVEAAKDDVGEEDSGDRGEQQRLLQQIYEMVGEVNSKFGTIGHLPIHFLWQPFTRAELAPLFVKADVMIDTPLRDVLTQSAHLFLCSQKEKDCGVLILSEFSGSAQSLRAAALTVNPWDTNAFADNIQEALEMEHSERLELYRYGTWHVHDYTLTNWASNFLEELQTAERECETERLQIPPQLDPDSLFASIRSSSRRLFIFGFSGTLVTHKSVVHRRKHPKLSPALFSSLYAIATDPNTHVVVISGQAREAVANAVLDIPCYIIAEGGVCWREPNSEDWQSNVDQRDTAEWLGPVIDIMEYFTARTPGSTVYKMESSVAWMYQNTQGDHAAIQSKDLLVHLWAGPLISAPAEVAVENDSVTVKPTGAGKASQLEKLLKQLCAEEGSEATSARWLGGDTLVACVGDFHADIYATLQSFFDCNGAPGGGDAVPDEADQAPLSDDVGLMLVANSMSLNTGIHRLLKKTPSESDLKQDRDADSSSRHVGRPDGDAGGGSCRPALFTCTVSRKPTRAAYHLKCSDTNYVAFLVAQMAHELRQAKQTEELNPSWERDLFGASNVQEG